MSCSSLSQSQPIFSPVSSLSKSGPRSGLSVPVSCEQRDRDEGGDPDQQPTQRPALLQEGFLLHHAGRHAAASPHCARGHDGTTAAQPLLQCCTLPPEVPSYCSVTVSHRKTYFVSSLLTFCWKYVCLIAGWRVTSYLGPVHFYI